MNNGNFNTNQNPMWMGVNVGAINAIIASASAVNEKAENVEAKEDARTTVEITEQYPWEDEVIVRSMWWDTPKISHILKSIADQIFDDVESAFVSYNATKNKVLGTLYFKFNAAKKTENGLLAFTTVSRMPANNPVEQFMRLSAQQRNGDVIMSKEGQDIISNWIYTEKIDKSKPNWQSAINWQNYVDIVPSQSESGITIRLSGLDMSKMLAMIINHRTIKTTDESGKDVELTKKLDVVVVPGPPVKDQAFNYLFEIAISEHDDATRVIEEASGKDNRYNRANSYISYI